MLTLLAQTCYLKISKMLVFFLARHHLRALSLCVVMAGKGRVSTNSMKSTPPAARPGQRWVPRLCQVPSLLPSLFFFCVTKRRVLAVKMPSGKPWGLMQTFASPPDSWDYTGFARGRGGQWLQCQFALGAWAQTHITGHALRAWWNRHLLPTDFYHLMKG